MSAASPSAADSTQIHRIFITASPEAIWEAITSPRLSAQYFYGALVETTGEVGTPFRYRSPDGADLWGDEVVLESHRPTRLVVGWRSLYDPSLADEPTSRVTWEIEELPEGFCQLTLTHDRLENSPRTAADVGGAGWMRVLSGLKSVLETGSGLQKP
ncbi:SRPBCC domain-containing protein [Naasia lichenicola]|uniref:ATPase n=1 Tax=Naasia lichenicola TaxID=2565933 RepID=A0A4S4FRD8_9MICO|nr:SRPBCC domain-containing protein [Naasia lichenicola]THG32934.1 ATPase [Naasia lichenicola]